MREISVRELKAWLSKTLRKVSRRERWTDDWLDELVAAGRVTRATKPHGEPPPLVRSHISPTEIILREREEEPLPPR